MQKIVKNEPKFFKNAKQKVKIPNISKAWEDKNIKDIKAKLREYIIKEQQNMCAYCEQKLENIEKLSIDHFKKRDLFPEETLEYINLFISCKSNNHCENSKDRYPKLQKNDYKKIIHPVLDEVENYFTYNLTGEIEANENLNEFDKEKVKFTIKVFNLNDKSLVEDRKKIINSIIYTINYYNSCEEIRDNGINVYFSLLKYLFKIKPKLMELNQH
jgi:uncharacterized protein (TIGR02646 family)